MNANQRAQLTAQFRSALEPLGATVAPGVTGLNIVTADRSVGALIGLDEVTLPLVHWHSRTLPFRKDPFQLCGHVNAYHRCKATVHRTSWESMLDHCRHVAELARDGALLVEPRARIA